jgi:hypothetical protein
MLAAGNCSDGQKKLGIAMLDKQAESKLADICWLCDVEQEHGA